jgi:hypothetical protein
MLYLRLFDPFVHSAHLRVVGSAGRAFAAAPAARGLDLAEGGK